MYPMIDFLVLEHATQLKSHWTTLYLEQSAAISIPCSFLCIWLPLKQPPSMISMNNQSVWIFIYKSYIKSCHG